jgi:hypothetical protein
MRIVIEIPDELLLTASTSPPAETAAASAPAAGPIADAISGGAAPDTVRAVAQSTAAIGMDALPAGAAEAPAPDGPGAAVAGAYDGGAAPS